MGISPSYRRRSGYGLLRHDARAGAKRCQRDLRHAPCHRRRRPELCARGQRQRRGDALRRRLRRYGGAVEEDVVHPHRLEHGPLRLARRVQVLSRRVRPHGTQDVGDDRPLEAALHLFGQIRREPHGGGGALCDGGRAGGPRSGGAVRRDPRPRLAHLLRRNRRQTGLRKTAGRAHARHGVRPQRREHQFADLCHRTRGHGGRRPCDRRVEPHAQHHRYPLRHSGRKGGDGAQRRAVRRGGVRRPRTRRRGQDRHLPGAHHLSEGARLLRRGGRQGAQTGAERALRDGRFGRYDEPRHPPRGAPRHRRPLPLHGIPARRGCAPHVPAVGRLRDALGVGTLRHLAARSDALERAGHHLQAERRGRSARLRAQSRLLGRGRPVGCDLCPDYLSRAGEDVRREGARRGTTLPRRSRRSIRRSSTRRPHANGNNNTNDISP